MVFRGGDCDAVLFMDFSGHDGKRWKDLLCDSWQVRFHGCERTVSPKGGSLLSPIRSGRQSKPLQPKKPTAPLIEEAPSGHLFTAAGVGIFSSLCMFAINVAYTTLYNNRIINNNNSNNSM